MKRNVILSCAVFSALFLAIMFVSVGCSRYQPKTSPKFAKAESDARPPNKPKFAIGERVIFPVCLEDGSNCFGFIEEIRHVSVSDETDVDGGVRHIWEYVVLTYCGDPDCDERECGGPQNADVYEFHMDHSPGYVSPDGVQDPE